MASFALLSSCAYLPISSEDQTKIQDTVPTCEGEQDCKAKWEAAQFWVSNNSPYPLRPITDIVIETYSPQPWDSRLAVRVKKEPLGNGKYRILILVWCMNYFYCSPQPTKAILSFNQYVAASKP